MDNIYNFDDTISAIATPLGTGGVGVIRISGADSEKVISKLFSCSLKEKIIPEFKANRIYYGWIVKEISEKKLIPVDEVIVLCFKAPNSFTGEDVFEIQCHGGMNIIKSILKSCIASGARLAQKGEFSKRAFMNGKMDLSKAEAVLDLIHSKTDKFSQVSAENLSGKLAGHINSLRTTLIELLTRIIAAVDFPEEVDEPDYKVVEDRITDIIEKIDSILKVSNTSNLMRDGLKVVLAGKPNVGKSSLFNAFLDVERAIVTAIPGTTRDVIQESIDIEGIPIVLTDTAGIRELDKQNDSNHIESIGIDITKNYMEASDIILFIYDLTQGMQKEDTEILEKIKHKKVIKIGSKSDLVSAFISEDDCLRISAKEKTGLDLIKNEIKKNVIAEELSSDFSTNARQQECLKLSKLHLLQALQGCNDRVVQDLISIDLKSALISLGEIIGEVVSEEIINNIFDNFCIGK